MKRTHAEQIGFPLQIIDCGEMINGLDTLDMQAGQYQSPSGIVVILGL